MKTHILPTLLLCVLAGAAGASPTVFEFDDSDFDVKIYNAATNHVSSSAPNAFDKDETTGVGVPDPGYSIVADFSRFVSTGKPKVYISEIEVVHTGRSKFSLYTSEDNETWIPVPDAQGVTQAGSSWFKPRIRALYVKYVFDTRKGADLLELYIRGWKTSEPTKISSLGRSHFIRGGTISNGQAGTNGGHYSDRFFDGDFTNYTICNKSGVTELIIPTTDSATGTPQYVTEFNVGHAGNSLYSLYYTTDEEPDYSRYETTISRTNGDGRWHTCTNYVGPTADNRDWISINGATGIQEQGTKSFTVNKTATAVKYVFDTFSSWGSSLAEVEVWAMDPDDLPCEHKNLDLATANWTFCSPATCTENEREECFCPDCGERFDREVSLTKLGHVYVATLTKVGRPDRYGSGFVSCSRTLEDPDTHETTWSCDFRIDFNGEDVDFTTLGGVPVNGVVQYTDLTASSSGGQDGGITPADVMDNVWIDKWNGYWFAETLSTNEYVQYEFGTTIELTKIEFSVLNQSQTVYFSKYDPETGEETILRTIPIAKDETEGAPGYQRQTVDFFVYDKYQKTFLDAIRMRVGDYIDPVTGQVTAYTGTSYSGGIRNTCIIEFHPWGTIQWAGKMTHPPTTILLLR